MDITLEQVEELRRRANLSYEDAKSVLEAANGSLLDALIALERAGRLPGGQGGTYSTRTGAGPRSQPRPAQAAPQGGSSAKRGSEDSPVGRFFRRLGEILRPGSGNRFEIWRRGEPVTDMPILILVLLMALFFWIALPLLILGLFFGFRYHFSGPDLDRQDLNDAMDKVSDTVDSMVGQAKQEYQSSKARAQQKARCAEEAEAQARAQAEEAAREAERLLRDLDKE